ncbi:MAG: hypothetical protein DRI36_05395 [Caldiserica bacterium]|nr:MAG: hypothetical protein DRI36_05395 [Caldisericota bacterium]
MKCKVCGKKIKGRGYTLKLISYYPYRKTDIKIENIGVDINKEIKKLINLVKKRRKKEIEEDIVKFFKAKICYDCHKNLSIESLK